MKTKPTFLAIALASAFPFSGVMAQTNADMQREIDQLKAQLRVLMEKVEAMSQKGGVDPQEFNRLVQKVDLAEENSITSGFQGIKFKGVIEARYIRDKNNDQTFVLAPQGFGANNGYAGTGMFEISKETEDGKGIKWMLRLTPGGANVQGDALVHEASVSIPLHDKTRLIAGLVPDWTGYEYYFGHQNPLVTHNLLFNYGAAVNYAGVGMSYELGKWTAKWMFANIDAPGTTKKAPGFVWNGYWTISEFSYLNFSGVHSRETRKFDIMEVDGGYTRGDLSLSGQLSYGREAVTAAGIAAYNPDPLGLLLPPVGALANGQNARWWGLSGFAGYKVTPRLQALVRADFINDRKNGGGIYFNDGSFGAELDNTGAVVDPNRGTNRYALSLGFNYAVNANTQWKTEYRLDRSSGFNFRDAAGNFLKRNSTLGTSLVVSF